MSAQEVIAAHMPYDWCGGMWNCTAPSCDVDTSESENPDQDFAAHVLDALSAGGSVVVELPKPDEVDDSEPGEVITSWAGHEPEFGVAFNSSYGVTADLPEWFDGTERLYAAALLAAADAADRAGDDGEGR